MGWRERGLPGRAGRAPSCQAGLPGWRPAWSWKKQRLFLRSRFWRPVARTTTRPPPSRRSAATAPSTAGSQTSPGPAASQEPRDDGRLGGREVFDGSIDPGFGGRLNEELL